MKKNSQKDYGLGIRNQESRRRGRGMRNEGKLLVEIRDGMNGAQHHVYSNPDVLQRTAHILRSHGFYPVGHGGGVNGAASGAAFGVGGLGGAA